jgi:hypothetical protein
LHRILAGLVSLVVWTALQSPAGASENPGCPADNVTLNDLHFTTTAAAYDTVYCPYYDCAPVAMWMEVDDSWPAGRFFGMAFTQILGQARTEIHARDRFTCTGIPGATSLTVRVLLRGFKAGDCTHHCDYGYWSAGMTAAGSSIETGYVDCGAQTCEHTLERTIQVVPDVAFDFELRLHASAVTQYCCRTEGSVEAKLSFPDLPAGASLRSCKGYASGVPTVARRTTWGQVKQIYR